MAGHVDCQVAHFPILLFFQDGKGLMYPPVQVEPSSVNDFFQVLVPYWKGFIPCPVDQRYYVASIKVSAFKFMSIFESYMGIFFTVMSIFLHPLWLLMYTTFQTTVALGVPRFWIHFLSPSGVVELIYSRNNNRNLFLWPSNNPKVVGKYCRRSKTLIWSKYLSASGRISELIDPLGGHAH